MAEVMTVFSSFEGPQSRVIGASYANITSAKYGFFCCFRVFYLFSKKVTFWQKHDKFLYSNHSQFAEFMLFIFFFTNYRYFNVIKEFQDLNFFI